MPTRGWTKPDHDRRRHTLKITVTDGELEQVQQRAEAAGLTVSAYGRQAMLASAPRAKRAATNAAAIRELTAIGNNLNQLARRANAGRFPAQVEIEEALAELAATVERLA